MQFVYLRLGDRSWSLMSHVSVLMNLTMQAIDLLKCGGRRHGIWTFVVEPAAKAAAVRIERRGHTTAAEEEGFHRRDPCAMSDRGMHQRTLARADGGRIHPAWIRDPGRGPRQQVFGGHGGSNSVPLAIDAAELQQKATMTDYERLWASVSVTFFLPATGVWLRNAWQRAYRHPLFPTMTLFVLRSPGCRRWP